MSDYRDKAKNWQQAIHHVLLREWDPIGVADEPQAQDEYDSYIPEIFRILIRREPRHKLIDFLWWVETEHMGLYGNLQQTERVADLLLQIADDSQTGG